jgi:hypothetical protein
MPGGAILMAETQTQNTNFFGLYDLQSVFPVPYLHQELAFLHSRTNRFH